MPPAALAQWIITHDGLPADACAEIAALAGRPIDFVEIGASTGYYDAKNDGFDRVDAARCDIVVFGDADCRPADDWLEHLLAPFAREAGDAPAAVAGRTSYAPNVLGIALTSIDFMYFPARCVTVRRAISTRTTSRSGATCSRNSATSRSTASIARIAR